MAEALKKRRPLALLAEINHPSGAERFWTDRSAGLERLHWTGRGRSAAWRRSSTPAICRSRKSLRHGRGRPGHCGDARRQCRNLSGKVWLACSGSGNSVVKDPIRSSMRFSIINHSLRAEDGSVAISITARTGFYTLDRRWMRVTTERAACDLSTDSGMDLISGLQNQTIQWMKT